ncbi:MAG: hypothetical protein ABIJ41_07595 [Candidatus Omnitrophota bacterium]
MRILLVFILIFTVPMLIYAQENYDQNQKEVVDMFRSYLRDINLTNNWKEFTEVEKRYTASYLKEFAESDKLYNEQPMVSEEESRNNFELRLADVGNEDTIVIKKVLANEENAVIIYGRNDMGIFTENFEGWVSFEKENGRWKKATEDSHLHMPQDDPAVCKFYIDVFNRNNGDFEGQYPEK